MWMMDNGWGDMTQTKSQLTITRPAGKQELKLTSIMNTYLM